MEQPLKLAKFWFQNEHITATVIHPKVTKIIMNKQNYILKEKGTINQLLAEVNVLNQLAEKGIKVQRPLKTKGNENYIKYHDKYYCMYEYVEGNVVEVKRVENLKVLSNTIGSEVAKLHQALCSTNHVDEFVERNLYNVIYDWATPILKSSEQVHPELIQTMNQLQKDFKDSITLLPRQLIHRDMHLSNLIFKEDEFQGFIDFELVEINVRVFDLCYCFTSILSEVFCDEQLRSDWLYIVRNIFEGYHKQNPLSEAEIQAIWYVMLGIQVIFITYFVQSAELLKLNEEMFFWILTNKEAIEETIKGVEIV
ncbi:phosphotransferase enzyme family protein [Bacillus pseudomycoides]|uniref:phosphotransferase enzyme family protein n=1 Tax=Bacillus pseudomycoides TaxID=64104 RepID=UPI000BF2F254|nr:phosphotransferase [Bacillus pseudomycoides]PEP48825.1 aminoglycoside phosphotransferase [Bacillus pseudomycoides]PHC93764.1 aminoglycoside phosphotransferase [Bacillus pseudomycoides]